MHRDESQKRRQDLRGSGAVKGQQLGLKGTEWTLRDLKAAWRLYVIL